MNFFHMSSMMMDAYTVISSLGGLSIGLLLLEKKVGESKVFGYLFFSGCVGAVVWFVKENPIFF